MVRENWIKTKYVKKLFVKKFRAGRLAVIRNEDETSDGAKGRLVLEDEALGRINQSESNVEFMSAESPNELLHLASDYGDVIHMLYAFALDADRNSIVGKVENYTTTCHEDQSHSTANGYSHMGYTPLIRAVLSVNNSCNLSL